MKLIHSCLALALTLAPLAAHAEGLNLASQLLLVRTTDGGFTPPDSHTSTLCKLYSDKVLVVRRLHNVETVEERALKVSEGMNALIDAAACGELSTHIAPTDIPTSVYAAVRAGADGRESFVDLGSGYSGMRTENSAAAAYGLKAFLDLHCPTVR